jgi:hypothetical protein
MALLPPSKLRPFSVEFAELITNMITEISRMSEIIDDLQRVRKIAPDPGEGGDDVSDMVIFEVWDNKGVDSATKSGWELPQLYDGMMYGYGRGSGGGGEEGKPPEHTTYEEFANGWDMNQSPNWPIEYPEGTTLMARPLAIGSKVLAYRISPTVCIFAEPYNRLDVWC